MEDFGADQEKPLAQRINALKGDVDATVIRDMHRLVQWRNKLVHDPSVNGLGDLGLSRQEFLDKFESAIEELDSYSSRKRKMQSVIDSDGDIDRLMGSVMESAGSSGWAALAVGALAVGAVALAGSSASGTYWRCDSCNSLRNEGDRRYKCRRCIDFEVCHTCWVYWTPPACGHRTYTVRRDPTQPWTHVTWPGGG